ncbi:MAG TPA: extradiol ring-cleavage dioxygenase [Chloroflexota bacterium]|nr:extradiol ring-cleavage dioxygenase [Chloroflexota bacterium]
MAEILGLGLSHYPGFYYLDEDMNRFLVDTLKSTRVPEDKKDPKNWPTPMQAEWGDDSGATFAKKHRAQFVDGVRKLRAALDDFKPDVVVIFGDDQYENFREDLIAPFAVYILPEFETTPFATDLGREPRPNVWGEPVDKRFCYPGHPEAGRHIAKHLLEHRFDISYAYKLHHLPELGHAFRNTLIYLDYDRRGWPYPIVPFHVNAYGSSIVRNRGGLDHLLGPSQDFPDPPAPSPARCFELGQEVARALKASPWRAAVIGSSSWSHAFLTEKNCWIHPDVEADRRRYAELKAADYTAWRDLSLAEVEDAGQHEILNWIPLLGAMYELGQEPTMCEFLESWVMNSCKCIALFPPGSR